MHGFIPFYMAMIISEMRSLSSRIFHLTFVKTNLDFRYYSKLSVSFLLKLRLNIIKNLINGWFIASFW